jgi:hypothetical protein
VALASRVQARLGRGTAAVALGAVAALSVAFFVKFRQPTYHRSYATLYLRDAPALRKSFGVEPPRFVEHDDGIVAYSLDIPAMSSGLSLDPEGLDARRGAHLYSLAYERGFKCLSTLVYGSAMALAKNATPTAAHDFAQALAGEDLSAFDFELAYLSASASLAIVCGHKR